MMLDLTTSGSRRPRRPEFAPEAFAAEDGFRRDRAGAPATPCSTRTRIASGSSAGWRRGSSCRAAAVSSRSRCRSTAASTCATCRRRSPATATRIADRRPVDHVLPRRPDRSRAAGARAVLSRAADEAAVPARLPGPVRDVRHQPQHRALQLRAPVGRSAAGRPAGARFSADQRRCLIQNADTPRPAAASAAPTTRCRPPPPGACPQCGEPKAPHRVCAYCGFYNERQVRAVDEE